MAYCGCSPTRNIAGSTPYSLASVPGRLTNRPGLMAQVNSADIQRAHTIDRGKWLLSRMNTQPYITTRLLPVQGQVNPTGIRTNTGLLLQRVG